MTTDLHSLWIAAGLLGVCLDMKDSEHLAITMIARDVAEHAHRLRGPRRTCRRHADRERVTDLYLCHVGRLVGYVR